MDINNINLLIQYLREEGFDEADLLNEEILEDERGKLGFQLYELNYRLCKLEEEMHKQRR